jgi:F-type H+-transporting ATPase subunit beta
MTQTKEAWTIAEQEDQEWNELQSKAEQNPSIVGRVISVIGPVIDAEFAPGSLPEINSALKVRREGVEGQRNVITAEVAHHIGLSRVRAVCLQPTDGLTRGARAINTGAPISVPFGREALGRVLNVLGE